MIRLYDYRCPGCGAVTEHLWIANEEIRDEIECPSCKKTLASKCPPVVKVSMGVGAYGYYDETLQTYVGTNAQKREVMREQGVTPKGETPKTGQSWV